MSNGKNTMFLTKWHAKMEQEGEGSAPNQFLIFFGGKQPGRSFLVGTRPLKMFFFSTYPNKKVNSPKIIGVICLVLVILVGGTYYTIYFEALPTKRNGSFSDDLVKICLLNSFWSCSLWVVVAGGWLCFHPLTDLLNPPVAKTHLAPKIDFTYKEFKRKP